MLVNTRVFVTWNPFRNLFRNCSKHLQRFVTAAVLVSEPERLQWLRVDARDDIRARLHLNRCVWERE